MIHVIYYFTFYTEKLQQVWKKHWYPTMKWAQRFCIFIIFFLYIIFIIIIILYISYYFLSDLSLLVLYYFT